QSRSYWDETQRITVTPGFVTGDVFFLTVFKTPVLSPGAGPNSPGITYNPNTFAQDVQDALDYTFGGLAVRADATTPGGHAFRVTSMSATQIDISPGAGLTAADINDANFQAPISAPAIVGAPLVTSDLPLINAYFPISETQTITFPGTFNTGNTYTMS